ncbi:MAG: AMP-binding protein [Paludibacter sp.]
MFLENILTPVLSSINTFKDSNAFCISEVFYSYSDFGKQISNIRGALCRENFVGKNVGLVANDDIETYASIFALWLEGLAYVPLHPKQPIERGLEIISQADIELVLDSCDIPLFSTIKFIQTKGLTETVTDLTPNQISDSELAYILFTSGSTGKPKGVPISRANLSAFVMSFWDIGYILGNEDRCLQPFDLTFDLSVSSYLLPILKGASVYTVPHEQIKYNYIAYLLDEYSLSFALMVPSTIKYLKPYFNELILPALKYSLFCGEALPLGLLAEWSKCVPNAVIDNVYGPTEDTIFCSIYRYERECVNKAHNGVISIGKSMTSGSMIVVDEDNNQLNHNEQGELCLSGNQLTPGYWNNPEKNKEAFFVNAKGQRYYRTGDVCYMDIDGDFMYCGRKDTQVKIQGYRIELGEIEYHTRNFILGKNAVAIPYEDSIGNTEIALFIECEQSTNELLIEYLKKIIPSYMIPSKLINVSVFPLNQNGKIDKNILKTQLN